MQLKDANVMVIVCDSYINMMLKDVLSYSSPLYGRRTAQIRLGPIQFTNLSEAFPGKSFSQLVEIYAVCGGVPKYLEFFDNSQSLFKNIEKNILETNSFLYEEPIFLLEKEFRDKITYFSILRSLSLGNHKLASISNNLQMKSTSISSYLNNLIEMHIIEKRIPITVKNEQRTKKGLYFIDDNFLSFWFKFVYPMKSQLELGNKTSILQKLEKNFLDTHTSFIFKQISAENFLLHSQSLNFEISKIGKYWNKNIEIDIMAFDETNKIVFFGECKYQKKPIKEKVFFQLVENVSHILELDEYQILYALFSKSGFEKKLLENQSGRSDLILFNEGQPI